MTREEEPGAQGRGSRAADRLLWIVGGALAIFAEVCIAPIALAEVLPKTATPLNSESVTKLYAGKTAVDKNSDVFFAPKGTEKGVLGKPKVTGVLMGTWSVAGNEICMYVFRNKDPNSYRDCYKYWQDGNHILALWSSHSDGTAADPTNGYYRGEESKLKLGDLVSEKYQAAGGP